MFILVPLATILGALALRLTTSSSLLLALETLGLFLLNLFLYGLWKFFVYPDYVSTLRGLPMPEGGYSFFGHGVAKFNEPKDPRLGQWIESIPNNGLIRVREAIGEDAVIATSPEMIKAVLVDNAYEYVKENGIRQILRLTLGDGLIVVEGDSHKYQKKRLLPSFGAGQIKDLYPLFWDKSSELVQTMAKESNLKSVAFISWCSRVTLDIIGIAALGKDFGTLQDPEVAIAKEYGSLFHIDKEKVMWFILSFWFPPWIVALIPFWKLPKTMTRITTGLRSYAHNLASERRKEVSAGLSAESKAESLQLRRPDILSALIQAGELSDAQLADQILTFMAAGHETTSGTLAWTAMALSKAPAIQTRLREEIRANLPSPGKGETVTATQMEKLPLLNGVCAEVLRLYPSVSFTARSALRDTRLGDVVLPKNAQVWLPIWCINRSPRFWGPDANEFNPDRWITNGAFNNNGGAQSNYAQLTFIHGPRSCVGQGFARAELRCLVAAVVGRFELELADSNMKNYEPIGLVTVKPENDCLLNMKAVDGW